MLRGLFSASPSLILSYDHFVGGRMEGFEEVLDEVGRYYKWVKLSELIERLKKGRASGLACLTFTSARKSLYLQAVPLLVGMEIPFTTFIHPECVGMNRLPPLEEFDHFHSEYNERMPMTREAFQSLSEQDPDEADRLLLAFRSALGPLPLNRIDPTLFFSTWGKIVDVPSQLQEFGMSFTFSPRLEKKATEHLNFIRQQTKGAARVAFYSGPSEPASHWESLGIEGVLTTERGMIDKQTSSFRLPQWQLKKED